MLRFLFFLLVVTAQTAYGEINIEGSSTILPVVRDAAKNFQTINNAVHVKGGGSSIGIEAVRKGRADIGMVSRILTPEESTVLKTYLLGYDGIAVIINIANPLQNLTKHQIVNIFSGSSTNWNSFINMDKTITVIAKKHGRSTRKLFDHFFSLKDTVSTAQLIGSNTAAIVLVAGDPTAIGYVSIGSVEYANKLGLTLKPLPLEGVVASYETVSNGSYPLRRPLNLVTHMNPTTEATAFIKFLQEPEGQNFLKKHYFVPLSHETTK